MEAAIEVEGLVKRYGSRTAVDGVSFTVAEGELLTLLGPNGAGKTTTVEMLEGFRRPDAGRVRVLGCDPRRDKRALRRLMGVMPQESGFYSQARPMEAVKLFAAFYEQPRDGAELLDQVGLRDVEKTPWRRLSGGERQRLSLALALVGRPRLLFLDEPTAGMDPRGRMDTWGLIRDLRNEGVTVVLTTHLLDEAERLSDRVAIIHRGQLKALGRPSELAVGGDHPTRIVFRARPGLDVSGLGAHLDGSASEERAGQYVVTGVDPTPTAVARLTAWLAEHDVALEDLAVGSRSLEQVFLNLTREDTP